MDREELENEVLRGEHHEDEANCVYCTKALTMDAEGWWYDQDGTTYCLVASYISRREMNHVPAY